MSWFTDANCEAESLKEHVLIAYAADLEFPSGHARVWTGTYDIVIASNTYTGGGRLVSASSMAEQVQLSSERWTYQLSGVDPTLVPESEIDNSYGGTVTEYELWINPQTFALIGYEINRECTIGRVNRRDGSSPIIEVNCESRFVMLEQPDGLRYTDEHHQKYFFSGDKGCEFTRGIASIDIIWGGVRNLPGMVFGRVFGSKRG